MKKGSQTLCDCGHVATSNGFSTGYGIDKDGHKICFSCCGEHDREHLLSMKVGDRWALYLCEEDNGKLPKRYYVSNWPGSLKIRCGTPRVGRHNIAGTRNDVWFIVGSGDERSFFHGTQYGHNSQICHIQKVKPWI